MPSCCLNVGLPVSASGSGRGRQLGVLRGTEQVFGLFLCLWDTDGTWYIFNYWDPLATKTVALTIKKFEKQPGTSVRLLTRFIFYMRSRLEEATLIQCTQTNTDCQGKWGNRRIWSNKRVNKALKTKLNKTEIRDLSSGEFKIMVIKMITKENST